MRGGGGLRLVWVLGNREVSHLVFGLRVRIKREIATGELLPASAPDKSGAWELESSSSWPTLRALRRAAKVGGGAMMPGGSLAGGWVMYYNAQSIV